MFQRCKDKSQSCNSLRREEVMFGTSVKPPWEFSKRLWITLFDKAIKIWKAEEVTQYILKFIKNGGHFHPVNMIENLTKSSQKDLQQKRWLSAKHHLMRHFPYRTAWVQCLDFKFCLQCWQHEWNPWSSLQGCCSTHDTNDSFLCPLNLASREQGRPLACWLKYLSDGFLPN